MENLSFNPQPPFRAAATRGIARSAALESRFNPQPPFRAAATPNAGGFTGGYAKFQSSAALSSGCNSRVKQKLLRMRVSILSRPFERLQLGCWLTRDSLHLVSILSRPFERLQRLPPELIGTAHGFNPQPPFRAAATQSRLPRGQLLPCFNPQPPFRAAATIVNGVSFYLVSVSILSRPFERLQPVVLHVLLKGHVVSILSRPFERLQHVVSQQRALDHNVSILSRPFERLQPALAAVPRRAVARFNPQPPFRAAATRTARVSPLFLCFNPQPPFRAAATRSIAPVLKSGAVSILSRPFERLQLVALIAIVARDWFQSSAALSSGCNCRQPCRSHCDVRVSILSRPFERLQRQILRKLSIALLVSILSRPFERLQRFDCQYVASS